MGESSTKYEVRSMRYLPRRAGLPALGKRNTKVKLMLNVQRRLKNVEVGLFFTKNPTYNSQACTKYRFKLRRDFRSKLD
jgi:hypothetical protein